MGPWVLEGIYGVYKGSPSQGPRLRDHVTTLRKCRDSLCRGLWLEGTRHCMLWLGKCTDMLSLSHVINELFQQSHENALLYFYTVSPEPNALERYSTQTPHRGTLPRHLAWGFGCRERPFILATK